MGIPQRLLFTDQWIEMLLKFERKRETPVWYFSKQLDFKLLIQMSMHWTRLSQHYIILEGISVLASSLKYIKRHLKLQKFSLNSKYVLKVSIYYTPVGLDFTIQSHSVYTSLFQVISSLKSEKSTSSPSELIRPPISCGSSSARIPAGLRSSGFSEPISQTFDLAEAGEKKEKKSQRTFKWQFILILYNLYIEAHFNIKVWHIMLKLSISVIKGEIISTITSMTKIYKIDFP